MASRCDIADDAKAAATTGWKMVPHPDSLRTSPIAKESLLRFADFR